MWLHSNLVTGGCVISFIETKYLRKAKETHKETPKENSELVVSEDLKKS